MFIGRNKPDFNKILPTKSTGRQSVKSCRRDVSRELSGALQTGVTRINRDSRWISRTVIMFHGRSLATAASSAEKIWSKLHSRRVCSTVASLARDPEHERTVALVRRSHIDKKHRVGPHTAARAPSRNHWRRFPLRNRGKCPGEPKSRIQSTGDNAPPQLTHLLLQFRWRRISSIDATPTSSGNNRTTIDREANALRCTN